MGHRVVHGGALDASTILTPDARAEVQRAAMFAPLHNAAHLTGVDACEAFFSGRPQVRQRADFCAPWCALLREVIVQALVTLRLPAGGRVRHCVPSDDAAFSVPIRAPKVAAHGPWRAAFWHARHELSVLDGLHLSLPAAAGG